MHRWLWTGGPPYRLSDWFHPKKPRIEHLNLLLAVHSNRPITPNLGSKSSVFNYAYIYIYTYNIYIYIHIYIYIYICLFILGILKNSPSSQDHHPPKTMGTHNPAMKVHQCKSPKTMHQSTRGVFIVSHQLSHDIYIYIYISIVGVYPIDIYIDVSMRFTKQWRLNQWQPGTWMEWSLLSLMAISTSQMPWLVASASACAMERCFSSWQRSPARGPGIFTTWFGNGDFTIHN